MEKNFLFFISVIASVRAVRGECKEVRNIPPRRKDAKLEKARTETWKLILEGKEMLYYSYIFPPWREASYLNSFSFPIIWAA